MTKWDKLNKEFDIALDSMTTSDWNKIKNKTKNQNQNKMDKEQSVIEWFLDEQIKNNSELVKGFRTLPEYESHQRKLREEAKNREFLQRQNDFRAGWNGNKHKDWNCEFYLQKHLNETFKSE